MELIIVALIVQLALNIMFAWRLEALSKIVDIDKISNSEQLDSDITRLRGEWNDRARELLRRIDNGHAQTDVRIASEELRLETMIGEEFRDLMGTHIDNMHGEESK